jgi:Flp pilus assembly protein TadB
MKLKDTLIFYTACALTFVGIYEAMVRSISVAYPFFMFATALLFWYLYRKLEAKQKQQSEENKKDDKPRKPWDPKKK